MPAKKDAAKASAPAPTAPAETSGAPAPSPSVDAPNAPADSGVLAPLAPLVPPAVVEPEPEEAEDALAKLASDADDDGPPDVPSGALSSSPGPSNPAMSEVEMLRAQMEQMRQRHDADMRAASEHIASLSHKPPAAPVPTRDPLREAKLFGVLATWKGPGTYGGPYYAITGVRMAQATVITTGYFPAADLERHADLFTRVT